MSFQTNGLSWVSLTAQALLRELDRTTRAEVLSPLLMNKIDRDAIVRAQRVASAQLCHYIGDLERQRRLVARKRQTR